MVKIAIIGTGYVGLTHAAVTSRFGHTVTGYDIDYKKIEDFSSGDKIRIEKYVNEKDLAALVNEQLKNKRLSFTSDPRGLADNEVFFMCLPTPTKSGGESDLSYLFDAAKTLVDILKGKDENRFTLFVNKSTVPIGTASRLYEFLESNGMNNFDTASNPEFLPEGEAVKYAIHSEKIVVGARKKESLDLLKRVYSGFYDNPNTRYIECENSETAEAVKYASNTLLYSQIVAWQAIVGRICEAFHDINFEVLRKGVLADSRIARWGSYVSAGAGGSCFKKDALSIARQLEQNSTDARFMRLIDDINEYQKDYLIERAEMEAGFSFNMKRIAILGAAFKQGTNDLRESNILKMIPLLLMRGAEEVKVYDPLAIDEAKKYFNADKNQNYRKISCHNRIVDALKDSDAAIIAADHQEFRALPDILRTAVETPYLVIDGRRMISRWEVPMLVKELGISYIPVAGAYIKGKTIYTKK